MRAPFAHPFVRALALSCCLVASAGRASPEPEESSRWGELGLGRILSHAVRDGWAYLALESGGIAVVELQSPAGPRVVTRLAEGRPIAQVWIQEGILYLVEQRQELLSYSLQTPEHPQLAYHPLPVTERTVPAKGELPASTPPVVEPATVTPGKAVQAKVTAVVNGRALFDAGIDEGFVTGKRLRVLSQRLVERPDLVQGGTKRVPSGEVGAVLRIEHAEAHAGMATLGRGDVVLAGDVVELTEDGLSERLMVPRRAPFNWRAGFLTRPFLGLDTGSAGSTYTKSVGILVDAFATYYFDELPLAVEVAVAPLGLGIHTADTHYPTTMFGTAAYATDYFEIGFGAGALLGGEGPCDIVANSTASCETNSGLTFNQTLRLGALDGLNVRWQSSIFSRPDRFVFGVGRAEANVPLTSHLGLFGGGGGGENGWAFGEFGVRNYLGGTGAQGTLIVSASLGYAALFDGQSNETVGGPSVAFGMEWRR